MKYGIGGLAALIVVVLAGAADAQSAAPQSQSTFNPRTAFAPLTLPNPVNTYRSANGAPGPEYWQNRPDYVLHASIDTATKTLTGDETITYTNNSPDALDCLWLQLDQNIYRTDSRARAALPQRGAGGHTDGYVLDAVEIDDGGRMVAAQYVVSDTRMQIRLPRELRARGGRTRVHIRYHYEIPGEFGGRTSWGTSPNGDIFDIAQWYPRMAVYDDVRGWDTAPYLAQEFYLDYGSFEYDVTVPADYVVAASGELVNAREVLSPQMQARLAQARTSDATVMIRTAEDMHAAQAGGATRTWRFHMDPSRDVAFSASRAFLWDAARINLPGGRTSLAMSFYPEESAGPERWGRSTAYVKHSVEHFSQWYPYPWPAAINVAGPTSGMEYPGIVFDGPEDAGKELFWVTAHEIGHTWFPMIVGANERRNPFIDEGFNTFIDIAESDAFENGIYGPKRDSEYAEGGGNPVDEILPVLADRDAPPIMTRGDLIPGRYRHPVTYFKSALGLVLLREQILGPERFDHAFRRFIATWAFRHPTPSDFFRTMESEAGEDLSWFWRQWYVNNQTYDVAVTGLSYVDDDPTHGAVVTVSNLDQMVFPTTLFVVLMDGTTLRRSLPVETWMLNASTQIRLETTQNIMSVTADPDHALPDHDRSNNTFPIPIPVPARAAPTRAARRPSH